MKQKSLITILWISMTLIFSVLVSLLIYIVVQGEIKRSINQLSDVRKSYMESRKEVITNQVQQVISYINNKRVQAEERVRQDVRARTLEAHATATYIFEKNKNSLSRDKIGGLIHDALYPASWDNGMGYYFAENMAGTELINRNNPELEGQNLSHIMDGNGTNIMQAILDVALSPEKEGFCYYYWNKPDNPGVLVPKVSYVKYFAPLEWVIANGKYIVDEEETIKKEVLRHIKLMKLGKYGYVFAGTWDGISLSGPFTGKNMLHHQDPNGVKVVGEMISAAKSGGGFVEYVAPKFKGQPHISKISYVQAVPQWRWYIGTGLHVDDIEAVIVDKEKKLKIALRAYVIKSLGVLALGLLFSFYMVWLLSHRVRINLDLFTRFFKRAAIDARSMDLEKISFSEFKSLAESANQMVEQRRCSEEALRESENRLATHLQNTPVGAVSFDLDNRVVEWNPAAESIFGYTKEEALGRPVGELIVPGDMRDHVNQIFREARSGEGGLRSTNDNVTKSGRRIICNWYNTALYTVAGDLLGIASLVTDITEQKRTEALLIQSEKMMSVGALAAGMAHEINNPLAGMIQNAQVIHNRFTTRLPVNVKAAQEVGITLDAINTYMEKRGILGLLQSINSAGHHAAHIVQNMLDFTRKKSSEKSTITIF